MKRSLQSIGIFLIVLFGCSAAFGQAGLSSISAKEAKAQRAIIKVVLENYFAGTGISNISFATDNLPDPVRENFPTIDGIDVELVSAASEVGCPYRIHAIALKNKTASVSFGNCSEGLGFYLEEKKGRWQIAPVKIERSSN